MVTIIPDVKRSDLQNRIDPWGNFHAVHDRGAWMGNRGILHDDQKQIVKPWQHNGWVTCRLDYEGNIRKGDTARDKLFTPDNYSELFFLDEATAFAAGHRPCSMCRNKRYKEYKTAWVSANRDRVKSDNPSSTEMDNVLQSDRAEDGKKKTYEAPLSSLPDGTMIDLKRVVYLIWRGSLWKWSFAGYEIVKVKRSSDTKVNVLTPKSIVLMFADGFMPQVHHSSFG